MLLLYRQGKRDRRCQYTVGYSVENKEILLLDESGNEVDPGEVGGDRSAKPLSFVWLLA